MPDYVWKTEVKFCVDEVPIGQSFTLNDMLRHVPTLQRKFPENNHVELLPVSLTLS